MALDVGSVVRGCQIVAHIDEGGMGTVYRARVLATGQEVAIKVLRDEMASDEELVKRFYREAMAAGRLSHPHIVAVLDTGTHQGQHVIVMELVRGRSVEQLLAEQGTLGVGRALQITYDAAAGLAAAHAAGIIHRDIKPGNLLLDEHGRVKVADFGIAKLIGGDLTRLTQTDVLLGTLHYASPEQFENGAVDGRSDIYSLGITLYHMLAGARPFEGKNTLNLIQRHLSERPQPLHLRNALVPEPVSQLVAKMVAKRPEDRFADCEQLQRAVRGLQLALGYATPDPEDAGPAGQEAPEEPSGLWFWAVGLLALGCGLLGWWLSSQLG